MKVIERSANFTIKFFDDLGPWRDEDGDQIQFWVVLPCADGQTSDTLLPQVHEDAATRAKGFQDRGYGPYSWSIQFECFTFRLAEATDATHP